MSAERCVPLVAVADVQAGKLSAPADPEQSADPDDLAALDALADELGSDSYATILTGGQTPTLRVVNRRAPRLAEDIHTGDGWFRGTATGPIAPRTNIPAAAQAVARAIGRQAR